jgi:hypothetical protein
VQIRALSQNHDLFVVTDNEGLGHALHAFPNARRVVSDEAIGSDEYLKTTSHLPEAWRMRQWGKLARGIALIQDYEAEHNRSYGSRLKVRTDFLSYDGDWFAGEPRKRSVWLYNDFIFRANRDQWEILERFAKECFVYIDNWSFQPVKVRALMLSDLKSARFDRLKAPEWFVPIFQVRGLPVWVKRQVRALVTRQVRVNLVFASMLPKVINRLAYCPSGLWSSFGAARFPSHPAFLHFLLSEGIATHRGPFEGVELCPDRKRGDH